MDNPNPKSRQSSSQNLQVQMKTEALRSPRYPRGSAGEHETRSRAEITSLLYPEIKLKTLGYCLHQKPRDNPRCKMKKPIVPSVTTRRLQLGSRTSIQNRKFPTFPRTCQFGCRPKALWSQRYPRGSAGEHETRSCAEIAKFVQKMLKVWFQDKAFWSCCTPYFLAISKCDKLQRKVEPQPHRMGNDG